MIQCDHPRHEKCLYWQYKWWDLCLSCGFMYNYEEKIINGIRALTGHMTIGGYLKDLQ